jgi:hypothetical protein
MVQNAGSMSEEECSQYCAAVTRDVDLLTCTRAGDAEASVSDARCLARYAATKFPHKHVVVDVDDHDMEAVCEVVGYCDSVIIAARTSRTEITALSGWLKDCAKSGVLSGKRVLVVFNRYSDVVIKRKALAAMVGIKPEFVHVLPLSPYIAWAEFNNKVVQFWQFIKKSDTRVADVRIELDRLAKSLRRKAAPVKKKAPVFSSVVYEQDMPSQSPQPPQSPTPQSPTPEAHISAFNARKSPEGENIAQDNNIVSAAFGGAQGTSPQLRPASGFDVKTHSQEDVLSGQATAPHSDTNKPKIKRVELGASRH